MSVITNGIEMSKNWSIRGFFQPLFSRKIVFHLDVSWKHSLDRSIFLFDGMVGYRCRRYSRNTPCGKRDQKYFWKYLIVIFIVGILYTIIFHFVLIILGYGINFLGCRNICSWLDHQCFGCKARKRRYGCVVVRRLEYIWCYSRVSFLFMKSFHDSFYFK